MELHHLSFNSFARILFISIISVFSLNISSAQTNASSSLDTQGLYHRDFINNIHKGTFINIPFDRDELIFGALFNSYVTAYAKQCDSSLPYNKVEILRDVCVTERVTTDQYGWEISRTCVEWEKEGTGLYASPEMNEAKLQLDRLQDGDALRNVWGMIMGSGASNDPIASANAMASETKAAQTDMETLIRTNGCTTSGILEFQENLRLFSLNQQSTQFTSQLNTESPGTIASSNHNYSRLMEDLVAQQSTTWKMNRYSRGSISGLNVLDKDGQSRPTKIKASYSYQGFFGMSQGTVILTFKDGLPDCLYFHDFPNSCRTPDRQIIAEFMQGKYLE